MTKSDYEHFLSQFAGAEGKKGGEFFAPRCVVRLLVEMREPYRGRVYDIRYLPAMVTTVRTGQEPHMPRTKDATSGTAKRPIESYEHRDKLRVNNPPVGMVAPETDPDAGQQKQTYAYDPHMDPQLVWTGKEQMIYIAQPYGIRYGSSFQPFVNKRDMTDGKDEDLTSLRDWPLLARERFTERDNLGKHLCGGTSYVTA